MNTIAIGPAQGFVIRTTHERGVGAPSSLSLATASHEAGSHYIGLADSPR